MTILYVATMVAIFILCLALLSTARRILRSSPLTNGELSISGMYDMRSSEEDSDVLDREEIGRSEMEESDEAQFDSQFDSQAESRFDSQFDFAPQNRMTDESVAMESLLAESIASESFVAKHPEMDEVASSQIVMEAVAVETVDGNSEITPSVAADTPKQDTVTAQAEATPAEESADQRASERQQKRKSPRTRKPLPHSYNYVLECLLLGVSIFVLVKTQRSNSRNRVSTSSRNRVA